jgi:hypothetical protein
LLFHPPPIPPIALIGGIKPLPPDCDDDDDDWDEDTVLVIVVLLYVISIQMTLHIKIVSS